MENSQKQTPLQKAKHTYELFASAKTEVKAWNAAKKKIQAKDIITTTRI